jgi:FtsZ-interacting cell division protein YlmF
MIELIDLDLINNVDFKCQSLAKLDFNFTNINDSYLVCCHGRYEPTFLIVSKKIYDLYKIINSTQSWKKFNAANVLISDSLRDNEMVLINLNKIGDEKYNAFVEFTNDTFLIKVINKN